MANERNHVKTEKAAQFSVKSYRNEARNHRKRKRNCEQI